ncbi:hypothetical protein [Phaeobacter gallaeciensis]|uniref:hypothetical protein n=1 Tax=Phaeobacter gallaeciensis TaxID=60890 RepID=UPI0011BEA6CE|nr:hypothetical protein [Phaeobacter gallaeciensis]
MSFDEKESIGETPAPATSGTLDVARHEARREESLQEALREAIFLRNWEIAQAPLKAVAQHLGLELPEDPHDWRRLASHATRAMLEVSQERQRRDRGEYSEPSIFFRRALTATQVDTVKPVTIQEPAAAIPPATFACTASSKNTTASETVPAFNKIVNPHNPLARSEEIVPAEVIAEETAPSSPKPQAFVDPGLAQSPIAVGGALYREARLAGKPGKRVKEKANVGEGKSYKKNSACNVTSTIRLLEAFFPDTAMQDLTEDNFIEFFELVPRLPAIHGKSSKEVRDIRKLIEQVDNEEARGISQLKLDMAMREESKGNIDVAVHRAKTPRLRVGTIYRHMQDGKIFDFDVAA